MPQKNENYQERNRECKLRFYAFGMKEDHHTSWMEVFDTEEVREVWLNCHPHYTVYSRYSSAV